MIQFSSNNLFALRNNPSMTFFVLFTAQPMDRVFGLPLPVKIVTIANNLPTIVSSNPIIELGQVAVDE